MNFPPIFEAIFTLLAIIATTVLVLYIITTAIEKLDVLIEAAVYAMKAGVVT